MERDKHIPKIIHYCWLSGETPSPFLQNCINTWKKIMPDYKIRIWDAASFDFDSNSFVKEAFNAKKWAFVSDYIRLFALYTEGGIYLDSDVKVFKRFDEFLKHGFFTSHEYHPGNFTINEQSKLDDNYSPIIASDYIFGLNIQAAIMGARKGNPFLKDCLDFYSDKHLIDLNGTLRCNDFIIGPIISKIAEKYGYKYHKKRQHLQENMVIYECDFFVGNSQFLSRNSYAIHLCNGYWREKDNYTKIYSHIRNYYPYLFPMAVYFDKVIRRIKKVYRIY